MIRVFDNPVMSSPVFLSPSPTDDSGGTEGGSQHGANYFFGFLIAFFGLAFVFIICGICSRRRLAARREAALNGTFEPLRHFPNGMPGGKETPPLYEYTFVIGEDRWSGLMPLSVRFWREVQEEGRNSVACDLEALPPATPACRNITDQNIPCHILPNWFPTHHQDPSLETQRDPDLPIQVAVMIAMPSSSRTYDPTKNQERLPEYQIGTISVPWHLNS